MNIIIIILLVINSIVLVGMGMFLVEFRDRFNKIMAELIDVLMTKEEKRPTWDAKYEQELAEIEKRRKEETGLIDLD